MQKAFEQMDALKARKDTSCDENTGKIRESMERVRYFLENLEKLLIKQGSPERKARFFRALFTTMPTYENIKPGNTKTPLFTGVNSLIALLPAEKSLMVSPRGFTWKQIRLALAQLDLLLVDAGLVTETTNATTITNQINQHEQTYRFTVV